MGKTLAALLRLQSIELQLVEVRNRLMMQSAAVDAQEGRIRQLQGEYERLREESLTGQKEASTVELELKGRDEDIVKLRAALNQAKTNKEYAAILTRLNTIKADDSKLEDEALRIMQEVDKIRQQADEVKEQVENARQQLEQVNRSSAAEVARLEGMFETLQASRAEAAGAVPSEALAVFERIAATRDGEAMAKIEIEGKKPPYEYVCGGCFMSIAAENANALRTRDELRFCDHCGRILYLAEQTTPQEARAMGAAERSVLIQIDGGARGNPGPAGAGVVLRSAEEGTVLFEGGFFIGVATNNVAEYRALLEGLSAARDLRAETVEIRSDSELLVRQMNGEYRVRNEALRELFGRAEQLCRKFRRCTFRHVRRAENTAADGLVNRAINLGRNVGDAEKDS